MISRDTKVLNKLLTKIEAMQRYNTQLQEDLRTARNTIQDLEEMAHLRAQDLAEFERYFAGTFNKSRNDDDPEWMLSEGAKDDDYVIRMED